MIADPNSPGSERVFAVLMTRPLFGTLRIGSVLARITPR